VKRFVFALVAAALVGLSISPAQAGGKAATPSPSSSSTSSSTSSPTASKVTCAASTAVGHTPIKVAQPVAATKRNRTITFTTNCGAIVIAADGMHAPLAVNAMTAFSNSGYFNQSICHRLTTAEIFVLQCGDPTASGSGGPAWWYANENLPKGAVNDYPAGTVALANAGMPEGHATNGSQFFLVYADTTLPPSYTIWGHVTQGLNILKAIAAAGSDNAFGNGDGHPNQTVSIVTATSK
jgi:peptidyl-prolyl cis-trans isomerase B (cyclophilin B)